MQTLIFFIVMLAVIILGPKFKINSGVLGLAVAFIIGCAFFGYSSSAIIAMFPTRILFQIMNATIFYGFANENGTMEKIAGHIMYTFRKQTKFMPIIVFLVACILSMLGCGAVSTSVIISPIAFSVAAQLGYDPLLASMAAWGGGMAGDMAPWGASYAWFSGWIAEFTTPEIGARACLNEFWVSILFTVIIFLIAFFWKKGYKVNAGKEVIIEKPDPLDGKQRLTITLIGIIIALVVIPALIDGIASNPVTVWFTTYVTVQPMCSIGSVILAIANAGDLKNIVKKQVPWDTIVLVCGVSTLMGMASDAGLIDAATNLLDKVPAAAVMITLAAICAFLSFFVAGMTVLNLLFPLIYVVAGIAGIPASAVPTCIDVSLNASSLSPFSMGGSMAMMGCTQDCFDKEALANSQMIMAVINSVVCVILAAVGLYSVGAI